MDIQAIREQFKKDTVKHHLLGSQEFVVHGNGVGDDTESLRAWFMDKRVNDWFGNPLGSSIVMSMVFKISKPLYVKDSNSKREIVSKKMVFSNNVDRVCDNEGVWLIPVNSGYNTVLRGRII